MQGERKVCCAGEGPAAAANVTFRQDLHLKQHMEDSQKHAPRLQLPEKTDPPRAGSVCPQCGLEKLDYNGLLHLACTRCGWELAGCFT